MLKPIFQKKREIFQNVYPVYQVLIMYERTTKLIPTIRIFVVQLIRSRIIIRLYPYSLSFSKIVWHTVRCGSSGSITIVLRNSKNNIISPVHSQLKLAPIPTFCTNLYIEYECTIDRWCEDTRNSIISITDILNNRAEDNYLMSTWWAIHCVSGVECNGCGRFPFWKWKHVCNNVRKCPFDMWDQRGFRSASTFAQSDQNPHSAHVR